MFLIREHPAIRKQKRFYWHQVLTHVKAHPQETMLVNYGRATQRTLRSNGSDDAVVFINIGGSSDVPTENRSQHSMNTMTPIKKIYTIKTAWCMMH